jgi:hypothetical protein
MATQAALEAQNAQLREKIAQIEKKEVVVANRVAVSVVRPPARASLFFLLCSCPLAPVRFGRGSVSPT